MKNEKKIESLYFAILTILAIVFVTILSSTTSPIYGKGYTFGGDSAIFQLLGKGWADGKIPYQAMFDHKGPFIFAVNAIGFALTGDKVGVYLLQCVLMMVSAFAVYKMIRLKLNITLSFVGTLFVFLSLAYTYVPGNSTEEYSLPFLLVSMYLVLKYESEIQNRGYEHPYSYAFIYGFSFGIMFLMRVTNAVILCSFILAISVSLIIQKKWKNLMQNALAMLLGISIILLPFFLYFAYHGLFYDMLYATILYNFKYATGKGMHSISEILTILRLAYPIFIWIIAGVIYAKKKRNFMIGGIVVSSILELYLFLTGNIFAHYYMVLLVCLPVSIYMLAEAYFELKISSICKSITATMGVIVLLYSGYVSAYIVFTSIRGVVDSQSVAIDLYNENNDLASIIPKSERKDVASYNVASNWFLDTNIYPCYKYYTLQEWQGKFDEGLTNEVTEYFTSGDAKWIVSSKVINNEKINDYLQEYYQIIKEDEIYTLWNRKN